MLNSQDGIPRRKRFRKQGTMEMVVGDSIRQTQETKKQRNLCLQKAKIDTSLMLLTSANKKRYRGVQELIVSRALTSQTQRMPSMPQATSQEFDLTARVNQVNSNLDSS